MRTLSRLLNFFPRKVLLVVAIAITIILSVGNIIVAHTLRGLLDAAITKNLASLRYWLHFGILVSSAGIAIRYFRTRLVGRYTEQCMAKLREEASLRITLMRMSELQGKHTGDYVSRFANDLNQLSTFFSETLVNEIGRASCGGRV